MKRREFIINSALTVAGTTLLAGCGKIEKRASKNKVVTRKFKDIEIPLIALGCMRLPMKGSEIDMTELERMVDYAMEHGANYFDTAYSYVNGQSEIAMGKVLKKYPRESFYLADKSPARSMRSKEDVGRIFAEQLKKCQTDYFDFYMVHNINPNTVDNYRNFDMYNELLKYKKEGKIKHLGFSFHGTTNMLKEVVKEHDWDFCMLQVNYLDWDVVNAKEHYEIVQKENIPVCVMEPLRGGDLCDLAPPAVEKLKAECPDDTQASFGLRWVAGRQGVYSILSGMSNLEQLKENIATFTDYRPFSEKDEEIATELVKIIQSKGEINCTACKYCLDACPRGINVPAIFTMYNRYKSTDSKSVFSINYNSLGEREKADKCIECDLCNENCPQRLEISKLLKMVDDKIKEIQA